MPTGSRSSSALSRPASPRAGGSGCASHSGSGGRRLRALRVAAAVLTTLRRRRRELALPRCAVLGFEPRRQLPREFVEGAVFHRRQCRRLRFAEGAERQDVLRAILRLLGVSTVVSKSVWCEVSDAIDSGNSGACRRCDSRESRADRLGGLAAGSPASTSADSGLRRRRLAEQFVAPQRGEPRQRVEIAANAEAAIAGKFSRCDRRSASPTVRPATGRRHRPASSG